MVRSILSAVLLITLVAAVAAGPGGYKKKLFMKYAIGNLFAKCVGQDAMDKFVLESIRAAKKCHNREFDVQLKPVYIKPYPVDDQYYNKLQTSNRLGGIPFHQHQQRPFQNYQQQQYQQYPQQQQYQQYQQQPQYQQNQQQQFRQPQSGYQQVQQQPQTFYGPGFGFQPVNQVPVNQVHNRQTRQAGNKKRVQGVPANNVVAETNVAGEAELFYYNKLKDHMTAKVGNFSCIMHEMGYFTEDNQVDLEKYKQAYNELTLPAAMKEEFIENIDLCQEVSECLPEKCFAKYPYGREYGRAFFFVMCEKKKAMEVCLKKQMVDDYYKYKDLFKDEEMEDYMNDNDLFDFGF